MLQFVPQRGWLANTQRVLLASTMLATLITTGCGASPVAPNGDPLTLTRLRPEPYSLTFYSGIDDAQRVIVRTQTQWQDVWTAIWSRTSPMPLLPSIDFEREMVIVAAMGSRPTGGFSILIESASESGQQVNVVVRSVSPARNCGVTQAFSQPVDVARVARYDGPVTFTERTDLLTCN